eukprot:GFYU01000782.1.p1 GENE.GFYU01000782.1~~GFYU01000782.1.p1  ORF type:complete len:238 (-),score=26.85 GFYU01000782.1:261-974(-)
MGTNNSKSRSSSFDRFPTIDYGEAQGTYKADEEGSNVWNGQSPVVPAVFTWGHGGSEVYITGSFSNWEERVRMERKGNDHEFKTVFHVPPGNYQYKFIVDGDWRFAPDQDTAFDGFGNVNNVVDIKPPAPPPAPEPSAARGPEEPYDQVIPVADDFGKAPPGLPPHLSHVLLNAPPVKHDNSLLPRPHYVTLNHMYCTDSVVCCMAMTCRTQTKFVTTVYYKPRITPERTRRDSATA